MLNIGKNADGSFQVKFSVKAAPGSVVGVAGSFNDWDPEQAPMTSCGEGIFQTELQLASGYYEYKFVVGNQWLLDDGNPNFSANDFGTLNSFFILE